MLESTLDQLWATVKRLLRESKRSFSILRGIRSFDGFFACSKSKLSFVIFKTSIHFLKSVVHMLPLDFLASVSSWRWLFLWRWVVLYTVNFIFSVGFRFLTICYFWQPRWDLLSPSHRAWSEPHFLYCTFSWCAASSVLCHLSLMAFTVLAVGGTEVSILLFLCTAQVNWWITERWSHVLNNLCGSYIHIVVDYGRNTHSP